MKLYLFCGFIFLNLVTFAVYGMDKRSAKNGGWRVSEGTLLLLALLGGTPAAYIARKYFRHKTSKNAFIVKLWLVIIIQICALAYFLGWAYL